MNRLPDGVFGCDDVAKRAEGMFPSVESKHIASDFFPVIILCDELEVSSVVHFLSMLSFLEGVLYPTLIVVVMVVQGRQRALTL